MKKITTKKLVLPIAALALVLSAGGGLVAAAHADTTAFATGNNQSASTQNANHPRPVAAGTVTAVNGSSITLTDTMSNTTYTVDASSATIRKHGAPTTAGEKPITTTVSVSSISVGDMISVQGTVQGTSITATVIDDGLFGGHRGGGPGVHGTVTAVSGSTLTISDESGKTYTVDTSASTVSKMTTISVSDINVGDRVGINGTVTGTTVKAKNIMDGVKGPMTIGADPT